MINAPKLWGDVALLGFACAEAADPPGITFIPHPDGQCQKPLRQNTTFLATKAFPDATTLKEPTFPGAEASDGSGGWDVWWSIPEPAQGCRTMAMLPFLESSGMPGYPVGREIINTGKAGCFNGSVPVRWLRLMGFYIANDGQTQSDVYLSSCCGTDACTAVSLNDTALLLPPTSVRLPCNPSFPDVANRISNAELVRLEGAWPRLRNQR
jgi:hypothetical protein